MKLAYSRNVQNLHLLNNANISDQWILNSYKILPELSDQLSIGWENWINNKLYQVNIDIEVKGGEKVAFTRFYSEVVDNKT